MLQLNSEQPTTEVHLAAAAVPLGPDDIILLLMVGYAYCFIDIAPQGVLFGWCLVVFQQRVVLQCLLLHCCPSCVTLVGEVAWADQMLRIKCCSHGARASAFRVEKRRSAADAPGQMYNSLKIGFGGVLYRINWLPSVTGIYSVFNERSNLVLVFVRTDVWLVLPRCWQTVHPALHG